MTTLPRPRRKVLAPLTVKLLELYHAPVGTEVLLTPDLWAGHRAPPMQAVCVRATKFGLGWKRARFVRDDDQNVIGISVTKTGRPTPTDESLKHAWWDRRA